ncbi:MAG: ribbon-helix-helix protein, CopG family [Actinomycetota bacterium]
MPVRKSKPREVDYETWIYPAMPTNAQLDQWAAEAEAGFEPHQLGRFRRGRPPLGGGPSRVVQVRLDPDLYGSLEARTDAEGTTASAIVREALRRYLES